MGLAPVVDAPLDPDAVRLAWLLIALSAQRGAEMMARAEMEARERRCSWRPAVSRICEEHGVPFAEIVGPSRTREISEARQHAYVAMRECGLSLPRIGAILNRDHTTVLYGLRKFAARHVAGPAQ